MRGVADGPTTARARPLSTGFGNVLRSTVATPSTLLPALIVSSVPPWSVSLLADTASEAQNSCVRRSHRIIRINMSETGDGDKPLPEPELQAGRREVKILGF